MPNSNQNFEIYTGLFKIDSDTLTLTPIQYFFMSINNKLNMANDNTKYD